MNILFSVITLIGGLAFFLFGMDVMSANLEKLAGGKLESLLKKMTAKPIIGWMLGVLITSVIQSSSATTVMLVGLVNSGLMQFSQTISVIFGAKIGTTITAWILSLNSIGGSTAFLKFLKPEVFSLVLAFIGTAIIMFSKKEKLKTMSTIFIGFAVLIFGMGMMSDATAPLTQLEGFDQMIAALKNPFVALVAAAIFTGVIQSSSAATGILQVLSLSGKISFETAIPLIVGMNIGTCATALVSSIGAKPQAKRVAIAHLTTNIISALIVLPVYLILNGVFNFAFAALPIDAVGVAIVHTTYNVIITLLLMPFSKLIVKFVEKMVPEKAENIDDVVFAPDERLFRSPAVAVLECDGATQRMALLSKEVISQSLSLFDNYSEEMLETVIKNEDVIDRYEDKLGTYLVKVSALSLGEADSQKVSKMLHAIGNFERLGDHAVNMAKAAEEINDKGIEFSESAKREIAVLRSAVEKIVADTILAYEKNDVSLAFRIEPLEQVVDKLISKIRANHIQRLQNGNCTIELGFVLSDILTNYERISDHCSNIAVSIIETAHGSYDAHKYLNEVKHDNEKFNEIYNEYKSQFVI